MGSLRTPRDRWIEAGLAALAEGGAAAVRIEALAKALGVTKGGFYGYFPDRSALLREMLDTWERESVDDVLRQIEQAGGDLLDQARLAGQLTFSSERLFPIDLAVRDWARRDPVVAERLRRVDNRRMQLLRDAIGTVCSDPAEVEARSLLAFALAIATHLIAVDHPGSTRAEVNTRASALLLNRPAGWASGPPQA